MNKVTKAEFDEFISNYPKRLNSGCTTICEPPFISYRDETIETKGDIGSADYYFDKEVARISMDWIGPNGEIDIDNTNQYWKYSIKSI